MHITTSEYQLANPYSTKDGPIKEMLKKIPLRLIIIESRKQPKFDKDFRCSVILSVVALPVFYQQPLKKFILVFHQTE